METEEIISKRIKYTSECNICKKKISGFSETGVEYNMRLHKEKHEKN